MKKGLEYVNYSGGADGSDLAWEIIGETYGVKTVAFSFRYHKTKSKNTHILTDDDLMEGWVQVLLAADKMKRYISNVGLYIRKLISRDWFQVKHSDGVFAIGNIIYPGSKGSKYKNTSDIPVVDGGTGYAVMCGILNNKLVYVFEQNDNNWYVWDYSVNNFLKVDEPILTKNFAGIGTRNINENGIKAIENIYKKMFD